MNNRFSIAKSISSKKKEAETRMLTETQFKVLMILFDDKGYAGWQLAETLGMEESNLNPKLKNLEERDIIFQGPPRKSNRPKKLKGYKKSENVRKSIELAKREGDYKEFPYYLKRDINALGTIMKEMAVTNKRYDIGFPFHVIRTSNYMRSMNNIFEEEFNKCLFENLCRKELSDGHDKESAHAIILQQIPNKIKIPKESKTSHSKFKRRKELHLLNFNEGKHLIRDRQISKRLKKELEIWWLRYNLTMCCSQDPIDIDKVLEILYNNLTGYILGDDIWDVISGEINKLSDADKEMIIYAFRA